MNKLLTSLGAVFICIFSLGFSTTAKAVVIDAYFGWNYVDSLVDLGGPAPEQLPNLFLNSITYMGASGTVTQNMDYGGVGGAMPDGVGLSNNPTYTTTIGGDGETTRTDTDGGTTLPIDWYAAGVTTPWGTNPFPTIGITGITAAGVGGDLIIPSVYVVGLIPTGANNELASALGGFQSDIYNGAQGLFSADPLSGITGEGLFIFSAASAVPLPPALWLFGAGLLGLIGIARRKKAA